MNEPGVLFATVLQQFWSIIVHNVVKDFEDKWLKRLESLQQKSGKAFLLGRFLSFMDHARTACMHAPTNQSLPPYCWLWASLLPHFHLMEGGFEVTPIFTALGECINREALMTQAAVEKIDSTKTFTLRMSNMANEMRRGWLLLCDGTNQFLFTAAFVLFVDNLLNGNVPLRWSLQQTWKLERIYIVDGVAINSKTCVPNCANHKVVRKGCCSNKLCWQRAHSWILLVLRNKEEVRAINLDITPAILSMKESVKARNIGCIPLNCGFLPFIWAGSEKNRDAPPFVERKRPLEAAEDASTWLNLTTRCTVLTDKEVDDLRARGEVFYTISGANRLHHATQLYMQLASSLDLLQGKFVSQPVTVDKVQENMRKMFLDSVTHTEIVHKTSSINATMSQMLVSAFGVLQLVEILMKYSV